ncbi:FkbM family methyltransferase [Marimonas sp. MJW-29]|uniref:FkbM family methyltransferase n=1 Tax=Sulfitobacter sediminis TaxID=3234186 RepID=A0ABV3RMX9_9RHOB
MKYVANAIFQLIRSAPEFRGRNRILKNLLPFVNEVESFYGPKLAVRAGDTTFEASFFARYGNELVEIIENLPEDGVFIEFGANTGVFSLVAARHLSNGHVISIEPNPYVFRDLVKSKSINHANNMTTFNFSIGEESTIVPFTFDETHTGKGHIENTKEYADCSIVLINADEFAKLVPNVSEREVLCKVDTEGSELTILKALKSCGLIDCIYKFYIEIDDRYLSAHGHTVDDVYRFMSGCNFKPETTRRGMRHYDEIFVRTRHAEQAD